MVEDKVYEAAVKGRADFRTALKAEREKVKAAIATLKEADCECGGENPDGSSPMCYRCQALGQLGARA
jgi:hypothetical protein